MGRTESSTSAVSMPVLAFDFISTSSNSNFPASILDRSRMSLIRVSKSLPALWITRACSTSLSLSRSPLLSARILWIMKVATVLWSSEPLYIILRHNGIISVCSRNVITAWSSPFTRAPTTPKLANLRYSNGFVLLTVLRKGYKKRGIWAICN